MADTTICATPGPAIEVELPPKLDLAFCEAAAPRLLAGRGRAVSFVADQVEFVGALGLQFLLSAARQWQLDGQPCGLRDPSDAFRQGIALLGYPNLPLQEMPDT